MGQHITDVAFDMRQEPITAAWLTAERDDLGGPEDR
jgi:hypothetical protein